jgi:ribosomal protein S18 acetylase RimI-like enzyme
MTLCVRNALERDLDAVVAAHLAAFPSFFMTLLGPRFLTVFYRHFIEHPSGVLLVACDTHDRVVGCLAGTGQPARLFRALRSQRGMTLLIAAIPALLRRPFSVTARLLSAAWYRGDEPPDLPGYWLLSSLGVREDCAGSGVGTALLERFVTDATEAEAQGIYLVTDDDRNDRAKRFYTTRGFVMHSRRVRHDGRRLEVLMRGLK